MERENLTIEMAWDRSNLRAVTLRRKSKVLDDAHANSSGSNLITTRTEIELEDEKAITLYVLLAWAVGFQPLFPSLMENALRDKQIRLQVEEENIHKSQVLERR